MHVITCITHVRQHYVRKIWPYVRKVLFLLKYVFSAFDVRELGFRMIHVHEMNSDLREVGFDTSRSYF